MLGRGLDYDANVNALVADERAPVAPIAIQVEGDGEIDVDLRGVTTDLALIVHALGYYAANSAARAAIGTPAGYAELLADAATEGAAAGEIRPGGLLG